MSGDDGYIGTFEFVDLPNEGEVAMPFIPQFQGYSLDLPITSELLLDPNLEWVLIVKGEFDYLIGGETDGD